jgi:hypothetical protein
MLPRKKKPATASSDVEAFETRVCDILKQLENLTPVKGKPTLEEKLYMSHKLDVVQEKVHQAAFMLLTQGGLK